MRQHKARYLLVEVGLEFGNEFFESRLIEQNQSQIEPLSEDDLFVFWNSFLMMLRLRGVRGIRA